MHVKWNVHEITFSQSNIQKMVIEYLSHYYRFMHIKWGILGPMKSSF